jgi:hypothetical protein
MSMVAIIDTPVKTVKVRAEIADQYEVCPTCSGKGAFPEVHYHDPGALWRGGLYALWTPDAFVCVTCRGRSICKRPDTSGKQTI